METEGSKKSRKVLRNVKYFVYLMYRCQGKLGRPIIILVSFVFPLFSIKSDLVENSDNKDANNHDYDSNKCLSLFLLLK